jgi:hypothetical protein
MCRNLKDFLKIPILVSLFVFFVPLSSLAVVDSAEVSWNPDTSYITVSGGTQKKFSVDIVVDENADSLAQCEMYVRCNKNVLAVDSVSMGSIWQGTGGYIIKNVQIEPTDSNQVFILYGIMQFDAYAHGPGVLATVRFRTRGIGESDLVFDSLVLRGTLEQPIIPSKAIPGKVYVVEGTDVENGFDETNVIPGYSLLQNYPNPFNPSTCVEFDLARTSQVKLEIYNILGSKVKTLVNDKLSVGHKSITWDGKDDQGKKVASGIYFYRLKTEEFSSTKRMLLLK